MHCEGELKLRSHNTSYCLIEVVTNAGVSVSFNICMLQHFLCKVEDYDIPRILVTYSSEEILSTKTQCEVYVSKMRQIAKQLTQSRYAGVHPGRAPLKLKKIWFFGVKSWFFTWNTPKIFAPPSARHNFFKLKIEILDLPLVCTSISVRQLC
jgi:hypothetical protein